MCQKCGCNTCETDGTALMLNESKAPRTILSEGLKHHIDNNKPLTEHFYRAGSRDYFNLIAEARYLYSRGILEFTNKRDIELLTETDQGHFGIYEGKKVPLDFPMEITEYQGDSTNKISDDKLMGLIPKMPKGYVGKNTGIGKYTISTPDGEDIVLTQSKDKKNWSYEPSNVALKILNEQMDLEDELANMEFGMDYDQLGSNEKEWVRDEIDNMEMREAYSGFIRNPEDPDSIPFEPTGSVSEFREDLRALFGKFKGDLKNPEFIKGVAQIMVNWKSLLRSQLELDEAKFKGKTVDLNKPTRGDSKKFKVYVNSGKKNADGSIKVKKVNFGHGGTSAKKAGQKTMKIRKSNPKARKAFRARHNCDNPGPKTMARYWSCKKW